MNNVAMEWFDMVDDAEEKKKETKAVETSCEYSLESSPEEMRLVFNCKECKLEANLKQTPCGTGVLKALRDNPNVDNVVLSDYIEYRYTGASMEMLKRIIRLGVEMDNLSMKNPAKEFFKDLKGQSAKEKRRSICKTCTTNPQNIFPGLKKILNEDIIKFYSDFKDIAGQVQNIKKPECKACALSTEDALIYLYNLMEEHRAFLYYEGFRVVI